jgi:hypothetical protein
MKKIICWFIEHDWELILGTKNFGWMIKCKRCGQIERGDYTDEQKLEATLISL